MIRSAPGRRPTSEAQTEVPQQATGKRRPYYTRRVPRPHKRSSYSRATPCRWPAAGLSPIKLFNTWDLMYNRSCRKKGRLRYGEVIYRDGARKIVCVFVEGTPAGAGERDALLRRTGSRSLAALARGNRAGSGRVAARGQQAPTVHLFEPAISPASRSRARGRARAYVPARRPGKNVYRAHHAAARRTLPAISRGPDKLSAIETGGTTSLHAHRQAPVLARRGHHRRQRCLRLERLRLLHTTGRAGAKPAPGPRRAAGAGI